MAKWNTDVIHEPSSINNGNQYEINDRPTREQLNALAENSFYASKNSKDAIETAKLAEAKIDEFIESKGDSVVTINGVPQPTWSADYVENEIQRSKNLFNINKPVSDYATNTTWAIEGNTLTVSGDYWMAITLDLKENTTYAFSFEKTGSTSRIDLHTNINTTAMASFNTSGQTYTATKTGTHWLVFRADGQTCTYSNVQVEEGEVATDYVEYGGKIVHEGYFSNRPKLGLNKLIHDNDFIVTSYMSSDGLTWYRIWASGWKEFGINPLVSNSSTTVTLPVKMNTNTYTLVGTPQGNKYFYITSKATETFTAVVNTADEYISIYGCGY